MKLPELGVKQPVFTTIIFLLILILGGVSYCRLPIDLLPDIEQPTVSVITPYLGVSAQDIETLVTKPIENTVSGTTGLEEISSISKDNISVVILEFEWGTDLSEAMDEIRVKLDFATRELPEDIEPPQVFKFGTDQWPVVFFGITASESWPDLRTLVERRVADPLKTIPGVGTVRMIAGLKRQIRVEVELDRLLAYNTISITQLAQAIAGENLTVPIGDMTIGQRNLVIRLPGEFKDPSEIEEVVVGSTPEGRLIKVGDVARVVDGFEKQTERFYFNDSPAIFFMVMKQSGGNTVKVVDAILKRIEEISGSLPPDIKIIKLWDTSEFIKDAISNLKGTVYTGGLLVILVVYLFLRNVRSSLIIAATIPYSLILGFVFMYFFGYTINLMTLSSLAIAIGMVVDNAIVIYENITRHFEEGHKLNKACVEGTSEVGLAVSASTITTVVIFVPLLFVTGFAGIMFRQLGFVVTVALFGSLFASLTLTPMMASKFLRKYHQSGFEEHKRKLGLFKKTQDMYARLLNYALANRWSTVIFAMLLFVALLLGTWLFTKFEFMADEDTGDLSVMIELAPGTDVKVSTEVGLQIMEHMRQEFVGTNGKREWESLFMRTGQSISGFATAVGEKEGDYIIESGARLIKRKLRTRSTFEYAEILRPFIEKIPGIVKVDIRAGSPIQQFFGGGKPVVIEIKGPDLQKTNEYAFKIAERVAKLDGIVDPTVSRDAGRINLSLSVDRERLAMMGLNTALAASQLRMAVFGATVGKYRVGDDEYDIFVQLAENDRKSVENLERAPVFTMLGKQVPVGNIATVGEDITPLQIDRLDQERVVKIEANTRKGADLQKLTREIKQILKEVPSPDPRRISVKLGGNLEKMADVFLQLAGVALLGLILVYIVMAAQFENYVDPLIIMFSVPFALNGVLLFILLTRISFTMYTFLGFIMLIGIVVNNAIVFVDYTNILRRHGKSLDEALHIAGKNRLRPILMTTITTVFGMLPMALSRAEGAELWRPLGVSVIGGLSLSTLVTLVLIPVIYHLVYSYLGKIGKGVRQEIVIE